ncbi:MAG: helix-turn-helix transcriptional regulator [Bacteroidota bacterium]
MIGVGFYFYIKKLVAADSKVISVYEYLLFLPAIFYGALRMYWYVQLHSGADPDIFYRVYRSGFFTYNELIALLFNLVLALLAIRFLKRYQSQIKGFKTVQRNWQWLRRFAYAFLTVTILNLIHQMIVNLYQLQDSAPVYLILLVLNAAYIYWLGFESFRKSRFLFPVFTLKKINEGAEETQLSIQQQLDHFIKEEEIFTNAQLKVSDLASQIGITEKELSAFIHEHYQVSFKQYINQQRIEKVKALIGSDEMQQYTLVAIAEKAGFSSKSSFNAVFKKMTGLTPSQYRNQRKN